MGAVLAGAVYGDHCSPISDTTILSSTGAGCNHIDHVSTQLPYATVSAVMCAIGYIVYGFMAQSGVSQGVSIAVTFVVTFGLLAVALKGLNAMTRRGVRERCALITYASSKFIGFRWLLDVLKSL